MELIKYAEILGEKYEIDTDYRVAIKCDKIINDGSISDYDRGILITGLLFGEDSPYCEEALDKAEIYLSGGTGKGERVIDFEQHWNLIYSAFQSQYNINLHEVNLHYQEFQMLLQGLKDQVLTDVIEILTYDMSTVKDPKQRRKILEAQKQFKIKESRKVKRKVKQHEFISQLSEEVKGG